MIGTGTGVVPFIAFIEEIEALKANQVSVNEETHLFFGCRDK